MPTNVEIKARTDHPEKMIAILVALGADFKGEDHQVDTYFRVPKGRLKLREGSIEQNLIHYHRENQAAPKQSDVILYAPQSSGTLKDVLVAALGKLVVVDKRRKIFFIENVKFHVDNVEQLGAFVEIEAIDTDGSISTEKLHEQCNHYMHVLGIDSDDLIDGSYSDMLLAMK